jgi:hypothetical protein
MGPRRRLVDAAMSAVNGGEDADDGRRRRRVFLTNKKML